MYSTNASTIFLVQPTDSDKYMGAVGGVTQYLIKACKTPLAIIHPLSVETA